MAASSDDALLTYLAEELGSVRMWKVTILCGIGLVLIVGLLAILAAVALSGSASLDDLGLPLVFTLVLTPLFVGGLIYGVAGTRALAKHELLLALRLTPPPIAKVEEVQNGNWWGVRFTMPSGRDYVFWSIDRGWVASVVARYRVR